MHSHLSFIRAYPISTSSRYFGAIKQIRELSVASDKSKQLLQEYLWDHTAAFNTQYFLFHSILEPASVDSLFSKVDTSLS